MIALTDAPSGRELVDKAFAYMTNLSRECRKALTACFEHNHKGIPFDTVESTMREEIESWFTERDKNIKIRHEKSTQGKPGEILTSYSGSTKDAHFKFQVAGQFTLGGSAPNSPAYLKNVNVYVDKRDFTR